jgi:prepilin signal peptidase PulO-like enzyme (type II secretory pathway)
MNFVVNSGALSHMIGTTKFVMLHLALGLPQEAWWVPLLVLMVLTLAALIDTVTSTVPDSLIFAGLIAMIALQGHYVSWDYAKWQFVNAVVAGFCVWAVNASWFQFFKVDAIGMGDAKWTALAVACFGIMPVLIAWGIAAWLALIWLGLLKLSKYEVTRVYFTPFLVLGLAAGLWWDRLQDILI